MHIKKLFTILFLTSLIFASLPFASAVDDTDKSAKLSGTAWLKAFEERGTMAGKEWVEGEDSVTASSGAVFGTEETWIDQSNVAHNNEPSIAVNPTNPLNLVLAFHWYPDYTRSLDISDAIYYTMDAGESWWLTTFNYLHPSHPLLNMTADPAVTCTPNGVFVFSYLLLNTTHSALAVMNSFDGGVNWNGPFLATDVSSLNIYDKEYIAADPNRPGTVYMSFTNFTSVPTNPNDITVVVSNDNGMTWGTPFKLGVDSVSVLQGSYPDAGTVCGNNIAFVAWYNSTEDGWLSGRFEIWYSISANGGVTWSLPAKAFDSSLYSLGELSHWLGPNETYHRLWPAMMPIPEIGPEGNIYISFSANNTLTGDGDCADLFIIKSTDCGSTWGPPVRINDEVGMAQYYGWIETQRDGTIHAIWIDHRASSPADPNLYYDAYYSYSIDQGDTWAGNMRVTHSSSISDHMFIGDYSNMAVTDQYAFATWAADRRDKASIMDYEDDIFVARMSKIWEPVGGILNPYPAWQIPSVLFLTTVMLAMLVFRNPRKHN